MLKKTLQIVAAAALLGPGAALASEFTVTVDDAVDGSLAPAHFANIMHCTGKNQSPHIAWKNAPEGTKSFVVTMYDQDAPTGSGWWHWIVTNIPATATDLAAGAGSGLAALPKGAVQMNSDGGAPGYGGACPPVGQTHRYVISVTAMKVPALDLPPTASGALIGMMTNMNALAKATLTLKAGR